MGYNWQGGGAVLREPQIPPDLDMSPFSYVSSKSCPDDNHGHHQSTSTSKGNRPASRG